MEEYLPLHLPFPPISQNFKDKKIWLKFCIFLGNFLTVSRSPKATFSHNPKEKLKKKKHFHFLPQIYEIKVFQDFFKHFYTDVPFIVLPIKLCNIISNVVKKKI